MGAGKFPFHKTKHFDKSTSRGAVLVHWERCLTWKRAIDDCWFWTEVNLVCKERGFCEIQVDGVEMRSRVSA